MNEPSFSRLGTCLCLLLALGACHRSDGGADGDSDAGATGDMGLQPVGGACSSTADCASPGVCEPVSMKCRTPGASCSGQGDCSGGTYCETSAHVCLPSAAGTPCASADNCTGMCVGNVCGCDGVSHQRQLAAGPLDIYLVLDRTGSMGTNCTYTAGSTPPTSSKACYAKYALADYVTKLMPVSETTLAFNVMSLSNLCDGSDYDPALIAASVLPVTTTSPLVQRISSENFSGGFGTRIEGALRGIAGYTTSHKAAGREMVGVLITDGDATDCNTDTTQLAKIISDHLAATGIRTFLIGMTGATDSTLEQLAVAGGAMPHSNHCGTLTPPCHFWSVGDGAAGALTDALTAIQKQATPLPCDLDVTGLMPPPNEMLDFGKINVTFTDNGMTTTIGQVPNVASCPAGVPAWYYDNPAAPTKILLCPLACTNVSAAGGGAQLNVVVGCNDTTTIL